MNTTELKSKLHNIIESLSEKELIELEKMFKEFKDEKEHDEKNAKKRGFGSLKSENFYMAKDFNAPIDDMKEYMF